MASSPVASFSKAPVKSPRNSEGGAAARAGDGRRSKADQEKEVTKAGNAGTEKENHNVRAAVFMSLLALQIGVQPMLVKECIDKEKVILVSVVVGQVCKCW